MLVLFVAVGECWLLSRVFGVVVVVVAACFCSWGLLGGSLGAPWGLLGVPLGALGTPGGSAGCPWELLGCPWGLVGAPWGLGGPKLPPGGSFWGSFWDPFSVKSCFERGLFFKHFPCDFRFQKRGDLDPSWGTVLCLKRSDRFLKTYGFPKEIQ